MLLTILVFSSMAFLTGSSDTKNLQIEPQRCPGLYCGRTLLEFGNLSECGACPRGSRPNNISTCLPCNDVPTFYDWLYLGFMALLAPALNCFFIDFTNKRKTRGLLWLHGSALVEAVLSAVFSLIATSPLGDVTITSCRVERLSDWYTLLYNPRPDYTSTLHCTQEAVYPLYTIVMVYYGFGLACMILARPIISSYLAEKKGTKSIYAALYFFPILIVLHAVFAGLIYYSFPYIVLVVSVVTNAIHFAYFSEQDMKYLFMVTVKDPRNLVIVLSHWILHAYGIIAITQLEMPSLHTPLLCLIPFPAVFYLLTVRFTDPTELDTVG